MCLTGMTSKRLTKHTIRDIAEVISGEVPATFTTEVLRRISAATFADRVAFTKTLQQPKNNIRRTSPRSCNICSTVTRHCSPMNRLREREHCYYTSTYLANEFKNNINTVAMLTYCMLLCHFRNGMYHGGNRRLCTLTSYVLLIAYTKIYNN